MSYIKLEDIPIIQMYVQKDESKIPEGTYCYTIKKVHPIEGRLEIETCPYWYSVIDKDSQDNGYCAYFNFGDWEDMGLLWDMVKECGINKKILKNMNIFIYIMLDSLYN